MRATVEALRTHAPDVRLAVPFRIGTFSQRNELGLAHLLSLHRANPSARLLLSAAGKAIPRTYRAQHSLVLRSDVTAIIDASGFRYSDQWGDRSLLEQAKKAADATALGHPLIFLPQAFGPFRREKTKTAIKTIVESSRLVFARDPTSYEHLVSAAGDLPQIRMSPDFTNLVPPRFVSPHLPPRSVLIVPNARMIDKTDAGTGQKYVKLLCSVAATARDNGFRPMMMVHDAIGDGELADAVLRQARDVSIGRISHRDPQVLKGWLSQAELVVGSRFHALVASLASGAPTLALGWSHKYDELMRDYDVPEYSFSVSEHARLLAQVARLAADGERQRVRLALLEKAKDLREQTLAMWNDVGEALRA